MSWFWPNFYEVPTAAPNPTATCRHCPARIEQVGDAWMDTDGWVNCRKDIRHQPLPPGLVGGAS